MKDNKTLIGKVIEAQNDCIQGMIERDLSLCSRIDAVEMKNDTSDAIISELHKVSVERFDNLTSSNAEVDRLKLRLKDSWDTLSAIARHCIDSGVSCDNPSALTQVVVVIDKLTADTERSEKNLNYWYDRGGNAERKYKRLVALLKRNIPETNYDWLLKAHRENEAKLKVRGK